MNYFRAPVLFSLFLAVASVVQAIPPVTRDGSYLYTDDGATRFYIKGVAYQPQGAVGTLEDNPFQQPTQYIDPLANISTCQRDLPFLKKLGVNVIRAYSVNSSLNHDDCMNLFSQNGIYAIIDLSLPLNGSIDLASPAWSTNLLNQYIITIDAFSKYDNVLVYNVGNEVITGVNTTVAATFLKAAARDIKAYLGSQNLKNLVGYAAIDEELKSLVDLVLYLSCDNDKVSIDIFGVNNYRWCGVSTFQASYASSVAAFAVVTIVTYFSEFGCISSPPRPWEEVVTMFGEDMPKWSGGIAFSYFPAQSAAGQFGMVTISPDQSTVTTSPDYDALVTRYSNVTYINSPLQSSDGTATYPSCPANNSQFNASPTLPPTPNTTACNCVESHLSCLFTPATNNYSAIVGELLDTGCSLLGAKGGTCVDISSNGTTGVYGPLAGCDPTIKLAYVMSQYYEVNSRNAQACDFAGNGTVNSVTPTVSASAVASSCFANNVAVFTPSAPATSGSSPTSTSKGNGSVSLNRDAILGMSVMAIVAVMSAVWTLA